MVEHVIAVALGALAAYGLIEAGVTAVLRLKKYLQRRNAKRRKPLHNCKERGCRLSQ